MEMLDTKITPEDLEVLRSYYVSEIEDKYFDKRITTLMAPGQSAWCTVDPLCACLLSPEFKGDKIKSFGSLLEYARFYASPGYRRAMEYSKLRFRQLIAAEKVLSSPFSTLPEYLSSYKMENPYRSSIADDLCNGVGHRYNTKYVEDALRIVALWRLKIAK